MGPVIFAHFFFFGVRFRKLSLWEAVFVRSQPIWSSINQLIHEWLLREIHLKAFAIPIPKRHVGTVMWEERQSEPPLQRSLSKENQDAPRWESAPVPPSQFFVFLLSMGKEKFCSLYMLRFELRAQNDNTISHMDSHWPKLTIFLIRRNTWDGLCKEEYFFS